MRWYRRLGLAAVVIAVGAVLFVRYCRADLREAIRVDEGRVVVTNLTGRPWTDVEVWLNDYYRAQAPSLLPDQRLEVPLDVFVGGYGRRFPAQREQATGLEVTARGAKGERIRLTWGTGRRR